MPNLPVVTQRNPLDMQVCVPAEYMDSQIVEFANTHNLSGTQGGWQIVKEGSRYLRGDPERQPCRDRAGCVHVMLEC